MMYWNLYRSNTSILKNYMTSIQFSMNSILKRKCTKDQHQFRKLYDTKARNNQNNKSTTRSNDKYGIT